MNPPGGSCAGFRPAPMPVRAALLRLMDQEAAEMARYHVIALIGSMALAATACGRGAGLPNGPSPDPGMSSVEANSFVDSLTRSLSQAAIGCQNRLPVRL